MAVRFSGYETALEATWQMGGTADHCAKTALGYRVSTTQTASDMVLALGGSNRASRSTVGSQPGNRLRDLRHRRDGAVVHRD